MRLIDREEEKGFVPFDITIRFESVQEARLMYHVMNKLRLWPAINQNGYGSYNNDVAESFSGDDEKLKAEIERHVSI
jgi:hypothetical protein